MCLKNAAVLKRLEATDLVHLFCLTNKGTKAQRKCFACPVFHRKVESS